jgi:cardiolipin synthase
MFDWSILTLIIAVLAVAIDFVVRVFSIILIPRNRRPQTATAWLLAIFFLPYIGIILFWLIGNRYLPKKRREKQREVNQFIRETTEGMDLVRRDRTWPEWLDPIVALNRNLGAMPIVGGNRATLHDNYEESLISTPRQHRSSTNWKRLSIVGSRFGCSWITSPACGHRTTVARSSDSPSSARTGT